MSGIFQHFWLKLLALVLGVLVWLHVATEREYDHTISLPVAGVDLGDSLTATTAIPDTLLVTVRGTGKMLLRSGWRNAGMVIRPTSISTGRQRIVLDPSNTLFVDPLDGLVLTSVLAPVTLNLDIDREGSSVLPVEVVAEGSDDGLAIGEVQMVEPAVVTVYGPSRLVERIPSITTVPIRLSGLRGEVTLRAAVAPPDSVGFRLRPDSVTVRFTVVAETERTFRNLPIVVFNSPPDQTVLTRPGVIDVTLSGPPDQLETLTASQLTASVDYRFASGDGTAVVRLDFPNRLRLISLSQDSVSVYPPPHARTGN